jgi:predicted metal-binding membrane protein
VGLLAVTVLAWVYIIYLASRRGGMGAEMAMPRVEAWGPVDVLLTFIMWSVMMFAMMIPSAAPMILLFTKINRQRHEREDPTLPTVTLVCGYLFAWTAFSALATAAQWGLHSAALLSPDMMSRSSLLGGGLLVVAGAFQWTRWKQACLVHCRSPIHFFMSEWDPGVPGALRMGVRHGVYCVGCCWVLMALLFVGGVMNLLWVAALAVLVLVEKILPRGELFGRIAGVVLIVVGMGVLVGAVRM